jgi:ubiquinone/menaquinone biosynthesis C-methylase UbiE
MDRPFIASFESPSQHAAVSDIIRRTSTNPTDVRDAVLDGLELSFARTILDLGCGFGFLTEALAERVAPDACIVGVDACAANERPYLDRIAGTGRSCHFVHRCLERQLDWPDNSFDLIVASYALYFFPDVLPEVARVLAPHGLFFTVTHTESSCGDLLRAVGLDDADARLLTLIRRFSAENAGPLLGPWFAEVERVDYQNSLAFDAEQPDDFLKYLRFKLPLLCQDAEAAGELPEPLARAVRTSLSRQGRVILEKNDAAFRCKRPRCP